MLQFCITCTEFWAELERLCLLSYFYLNIFAIHDFRI